MLSQSRPKRRIDYIKILSKILKEVLYILKCLTCKYNLNIVQKYNGINRYSYLNGFKIMTILTLFRTHINCTCLKVCRSALFHVQERMDTTRLFELIISCSLLYKIIISYFQHIILLLYIEYY